MKIVLIFYVSLFLVCFLQAQEIWSQTYQPYYYEDGGNHYEVGYIRECPDGGYLINGHYWFFGDDLYDFHWRFLLKTDVDGNLEWNLIIQDEGCTIDGFVVLEDGSFLIAGEDIFDSHQYIQKRNSEGDIVWTFDHNHDYRFNSVTLTNDGNMIITGASMDGTMNIQKFDLEGNLLWRQTYLPEGFNYASGISIIQTNDNGFAITGSIESSNIFIMKTNEVGDSLWTKIFDEQAGYARGDCIIEDSYDNLFISGYFNNDVGGVLMKLDSYGNVNFYLTEQDSSRDYYFRSMVNNSDDIIGYGRGNLYSYSNQGDSLWVSYLNGFNGSSDHCLQKLENGYICVGTGESNNDKFVIITKTDELGNFTSLNNFELSNINNVNIQCYPNPFNPSTTIKFSIQNNSKIEISMYNIKGQKIKTIANNDYSQGSHSIIWNGNDESGESVSSGVYLYKLDVNGKIEAVKKCLLLK